MQNIKVPRSLGWHMVWILYLCDLLPVIVATIVHEHIKENKGNVFYPKPMHPGPWVSMTLGEIWPKPKHQEKYATFLVLNIKSFNIKVSIFNTSLNIWRSLKYN